MIGLGVLDEMVAALELGFGDALGCAEATAGVDGASPAKAITLACVARGNSSRAAMSCCLAPRVIHVRNNVNSPTVSCAKSFGGMCSSLSSGSTTRATSKLWSA
jgi:hypothetical protein